MLLRDNEYIEFLASCKRQIIINENLFKITHDPLLLADFCIKNLKKDGSLLDIGAGNGILPLLLSQNIHLQKITAVEIQQQNFEYLEKNIELNLLKDKIHPYNSDINDFFPQNEFDYIISNPPYYRLNSGILPKNENISIAKFEIKMTLENLALNIKRLLKNHGFFYLIITPERLNDLLKALYFHKFNILKLQTVIKNSKVKFILIEGQKGSRSKDTIVNIVDL